MVSSTEIMGLKRIIAKNPKSLAFAWLADLLREASSGDKQKLDEALLTVNKGLEIYSNFLPGRLARGRILLEKGDLAGAKSDFEAVAEQDSFCSSAQKLLIETSEKLGQPLKTEIYEKILGTLEPGAASKAKPKTELPKTELPKTESPKAEPVGVNAALDNLLDEEDDTDDKEDTVVSNLLLQTFDNIFESVKQEPPKQEPPKQELAMPDLVPYSPPARKSPPPAPDLDALLKEQLTSKVENVPDLTGDIDSLLASAPDFLSDTNAPAPSSSPTPQSSPDVDALIKEQLTSKVENVPDLTGDIDSLLASAPDFLSDNAPAPSSSPTPPSSPDVDALIKEQLTSKVENVPDLTGDIDSLLASAPDFLSDTNAPAPSSSPTPPSSPDVDALIKEQLTSKVENVPDLTGDIDSLLASAPDFLSDNAPAPSSSPTPPSSPDVDALIKEQLTSKVENMPDLTGDMDSLLASAPDFLSDTNAPAPSSSPTPPSSPDVDALIKEQLSSKVENLPDLTGDMDSLLASPIYEEPAIEPPLSTSHSFPPISNAPDVDALIKEQLSSKVENLPDLTSAMDSLLASPVYKEPYIEPSLSASYSMVTSSAAGSPKSPNIDDLIKEQLSSKVENLPDLTGDMDSLLASVPASGSDSEPELMPYVPPTSKTESMLAQTPTLTLAELYMDQGLPQKAVEVYKELLVQDPNNEDLKARLALAETKV